MTIGSPPWLAMLAFALAASYLLGSVSFAMLVSRAMGLADPRSYGSRNPGATNVLRSGSKVAAFLTLIGDAAKGAVAVGLCLRFGPAVGLGPVAAAWCGVAAFGGHLYPVFLGFRGGKGVATFLGTLLTISPGVGVASCAVWLLVALLFRYSSAASVSAGVFAPLMMLAFGRYDGAVAAVAVMSLALVWRHRGNLANLRAGTERKIGSAPGAAGTAGEP
jgi:glycerol-3-phosphate acyltransferase PlsY